MNPLSHRLARVLLGGALLLAGDVSSSSQAQDSLDARAKEAIDLAAKGEAVQALAAFERLAADPGLATRPSLHADVLFRTGAAAFVRNDYTKSNDYYTRARETSLAAGEPVLAARSLLGLCQTHKNRGDYPRALEFCRRAIPEFEAQKNDDGGGRTWMVLASVEDLSGRYRDALASYANARRLFGTATHTAAVRLLNEIGISYKNLGEYEVALEHYRQALEAQIKSGDRYGQGVTLHNTAVAYSLVGDTERALDAEQRALTIAREVNDFRGQSIVVGTLGRLLYERGDLTRAAEYLNQQLELTQKLGNRNEESLARKNLGDVEAKRGDQAAARRHYEQALAIQRQAGARTREASTLLALAEMELGERNVAASERLAAEALAIAVEALAPELEWQVRLTAARAARAAGRLSDAVEHLTAGTRLVSDLRAHVRSDVAKIGFIDQRQDIFRELASTLVAANRPADALAAAEAGRARAFADLLEQRQIIGHPKTQPRLSELRTLLDEVRARPTAVRATSSPDGTRSGPSIESHFERLREEDRELSSLITAESPDAAEIRQIAARLDATIVEYLVTDRELIVWTIPAAGEVSATVVNVGRERLQALVEAARTSIEARTPTTPSATTRSARSANPLQELHQLVIDPIAARLPTTPDSLVVIIADGPLTVLPFAALEDRTRTPLIVRHTLASAPAVSVFRYTRQKARPAAATASALLVVDPLPPPDSGLALLPYAREEGRLIARHLGSTAVTVLSGSRASESAVKSGAAAHRILHLATHGLISAARPLASSLVLSPGDGEDGYLQASEVFSLPLSADLVVLSGCSTGLGRVSGDGIVGLSRAFMYAGTPRVLVSQWDVSDRATAYLMDRFYGALGDQQSPAAALRRAQMETRKRFPQPVDWAAFVLIGEPRYPPASSNR